MKHTIIALSLLIVLLIILIFNGRTVISINDELMSLFKSLPENEPGFLETDHIEKIYDYWMEKRTFLSFTIHFTELERTDEAIADMIAAKKGESYDSYLSARERLYFALEMLSAGERLKFNNIF